MSADLLAAVEAMYATELSTEEWLRQVAETCRPAIDLHGLGIVAGLYSCPDPCSFAPQAAFMVGLDDALQAVFVEGFGGLSPIFIADGFLSRSCFFGATVRGWQDIPPVRSGAMRKCGAVDSLQINAVEPDGEGCWITSPLAETVSLSDETLLALTSLARHLASAHRLRRRYRDAKISEKDADATVELTGRVRAARGDARQPVNREALARGASSVAAIRRRGKATDARALTGWEALIADRWTLVDDPGHDGRLLLALENREAPLGVNLLSPRERDVLVRALKGDDNKVIAYDLGLAQSTVRVLLTRAAAKMGARSRRELLEKSAALLLTRRKP